MIDLGIILKRLPRNYHPSVLYINLEMAECPEISSDLLEKSKGSVETSYITAKVGWNIKELRRKSTRLAEAGTLLEFYRILRKKGI